MTTPYHANTGEIRAFVLALFRYAGEGTYISLRAFEQGDGGAAPPRFITPLRVNGDMEKVVRDATVAAETAAQCDTPLVFCPPICTFSNGFRARLVDLANGLALSVEVDDGDPDEARLKLEAILGPPTFIVRSGSSWTDPVTGEVKPKIHLHWRLNEPTTTVEDHDRLRHARSMATLLCGGDPTAKPVVHPLRWPGSWNMKNTARPTMATGIPVDVDVEIDLGDAIEKLEAAVEAAGLLKSGDSPGGSGQSSTPEARLKDVISAMAALPNPGEDVSYQQWVRLGYAVCRATGNAPEAFDIWDRWSQKSAKYDAKQTSATWKRILASTASAPPKTVGAGTIFYLASAAGWVRPIPFASKGNGHDPANDDAFDPGKPIPPFEATDVATLDFENMQPRQWVYGREIIRGFVSVLASPGGTGKTAYTMVVGVSIALGRSLFSPGMGAVPPNLAVHKQGNVWFYNLEDPSDELRRRLKAVMLFHKVSLDALKGRVFLDSGRDRPLVIAIRGQGGSLIVAPLVDPMIAELKRRKMAALIIDPFVQSHSAEENRNEEMNLVMSLWSYVASKANCAIWLVHHFRKGGQGGDAEAVRGAGAIQGAARSMYTLAGMSVEEAANLGIQPDERWQYIRHDNVKQNMAAPAGSAAWYKLVDVSINNPTEDYPEGDHVQSVTTWKPPTAWAELSWERIEKILAKIERGPEPGEFYALSRQAKERWAGQAIMDICGNSYAQATQILKAWTDSGVLVEADYQSPSKKRATACVRVDPIKASEMRQAYGAEKRKDDDVS